MTFLAWVLLVVSADPVPVPRFVAMAPLPRFADPLPIPQFTFSSGQSKARRQNKDEGLSLVMITSDTVSACGQMKRIIASLAREKWNISYVSYEEPAASQWLEMYNVTGVPYFITYRGHEALEVTMGPMSVEDLSDWLDRLENGTPPQKGSRFVRCWVQDSLKPVDREYLQLRMSAGSCGMLGCMAHGGGWVTETARDVPDNQKPKGHWEDRQEKVCGPNGCEVKTKKVWVADPDPTGTVPWPQDQNWSGGGLFWRRAR